MSISEVNVYDAPEGSDLPPPRATAGAWALTVDMPLVPVSAAIEWASGRLLVWSSFAWNAFGGGSAQGHQTVTAIYDPVAQLVSERTITNTDHDMFCEVSDFLRYLAEYRLASRRMRSDSTLHGWPRYS